MLTGAKRVYEFGSLKSKLEAEWNRPGVRFANHFVKWTYHGNGQGISGVGYLSEVSGLYYRLGRKCSPKKVRLAAKRNRPAIK